MRKSLLFTAAFIFFSALLVAVTAIREFANDPASTQKPTPSGSAHQPYSPPSVACQQLQLFVNRLSVPHERMNPDDLGALPPTLQDADLNAIRMVLRDKEDKDNVRNEAANLLRKYGATDLDALLLEILNDPTESNRFRAFSVQHLTCSIAKSPIVKERLRSATNDSALEVRREAIQALLQIKDPSIAGFLDSALRKSNPQGGILDLAIRQAGKDNRTEFLPQIRKYALNEDEIVRISAINVLGDFHDDLSRDLFEKAAQSQSPRIQSAGKHALASFGSLNRILPRQKQTVESLSKVLLGNQIELRHQAALALLRYGEKATPALRSLVWAVNHLDATCKTAHIAGYLDNLRRIGVDQEGAGEALLALLDERALIYQNRRKSEVLHLRAYILLTLTDMHAVSKAAPYVAEFLANSDRQMTYTYAVGAYAASKLGPDAKIFVPLLVRALEPTFEDAELSLGTFHAPITPATRTSARIESMRALQLIGPEASAAVPLLQDLARMEPNECARVPPWRSIAEKALAAIESEHTEY
jgi:HEAT repeat protein